jgi:hypothetical protein
MLSNLAIDNLAFDDKWMDNHSILFEDIRKGWFVSINALAYATGMSDQEIIDFLDSKGIEHIGGTTTYNAVVELKDWYLKRMRRYLRNGLAHNLELGSADEFIFLQFGEEYRKVGHQEVMSWDDIDEFRLLQDFEARCLSDFFDVFSIEPRGTCYLLDRIHRSFLFHLRFKKSPKHNECRVRTILSIILCNRYHIFTAEADSNVDTTDYKASKPNIVMFNPPRSTSRHFFASRAKG